MVSRLFLLLLCLLLSACATRPEAAHAESRISCSESKPHRLYVTNHGWHTGLVIDAGTLIGHIGALGLRFPEARFIEVGWGDAGFYQAEEISAGLALKALAWPSKSVMHLVGFTRSPADYFDQSEVIELSLGASQMASLLAFIASSFDTSARQGIQATRPGIYGDSQFYMSVGTYSLFNTCNNWTARALHKAGLNISPAFKMTASSVMGALRDLPVCND